MAKGSRGPAGYPDWQRQVPVTSPVLSSLVPFKTKAVQVTAPLYVGNFSALTGRVVYKHQAGGAAALIVEVEWGADRAFATIAGKVAFILNLLLTPTAYQFLLPNLGPWAKMGIGAVAPGGEFELGWTVSATSREQATVSQVEQPVLVKGEGKVLAGAEGQANPRYNFSGPCSFTFKSSQADVVARLISQDVETGASVVISSHQVAEAGVFDEFTWETPMGSWEVGILNNSAAETTYEIQALPSITGAS